MITTLPLWLLSKDVTNEKKINTVSRAIIQWPGHQAERVRYDGQRGLQGFEVSHTWAMAKIRLYQNI